MTVVENLVAKLVVDLHAEAAALIHEFQAICLRSVCCWACLTAVTSWAWLRLLQHLSAIIAVRKATAAVD